jgi:hypothetical protein
MWGRRILWPTRSCRINLREWIMPTKRRPLPVTRSVLVPLIYLGSAVCMPRTDKSVRARLCATHLPIRKSTSKAPALRIVFTLRIAGSLSFNPFHALTIFDISRTARLGFGTVPQENDAVCNVTTLEYDRGDGLGFSTLHSIGLAMQHSGGVCNKCIN